MEVTVLKFKKSKMLLGTMCALVLATTIGAFPSKAESAFDYNYYFWKYPDVANAVGFDPQALWRAAAGHVDTAEERKAFLMTIPPADPNNADSDLPKLDPIYYYNTYPDVAKVVGKNAQGLLEHYFAYGYSEGRLPYYGADPCTEVQTSY